VPVDVGSKRGRGRPRKVQLSSPVELVKRDDEQLKKRKRSVKPAEALIDIPKPTENIAQQKTEQTPIAAPINESVFQSGFRSVKKLLWRSDAV
jgi:hypothetical protein